MEKQYTRETLLISAEALKEKLGSESLCLIDVRAAEDFAQGHISGAVHFDHVLELRGVSENKEVVVYENNSGMRAARALWFLDYFGHPNARLLDGGMQAWKAAGLATTTEVTSPKGAGFKISEHREVLATADDVLQSLNKKNISILDTRSRAEYVGRQIRAARGGAIPGAIHIEWTDNLDASGKFKSDAELKAMYSRAGVTPDKEVISYCQGGYRAAHSYVALRLIGFPKIRNYIGSWKEWGDRADLPVEQPAERK
jgi:thiosulfate/3-mercaptopyruvate sulfurtransferase